MKKYLVLDSPEHKIIYGSVKDLGDGKFKFTGRKREDVTMEVLGTAFEWFLKHERDDQHKELQFEGIPYKLTLVKVEEQEDVKTED